jgi:hypothetical protein
MRGAGKRIEVRHLLACLLASACAAAPRPAVTSPAHAAPIDVDSADRDRLVHVTLESQAGTLVAWTLPGDDDAFADDSECMRDWQCDSRAHATWDAGMVVLAARSTETSANGTPGGWIGMLLPWGERTAMAVRSWTVDWGEREFGDRDDELVTLTLPDLAIAPVYVPGGRLRAMGIVSGHAILLVSSRDGTHHVVAVDRSGHEVARSEALVPTPEILTTGTPPTEHGLPYAAPLDASTFVLVCTEAGELCTLAFDGVALTLAHTGVSLDDGLVLSARGVRVAHGDDCRTIDAPDLSPCDDPIESYASDGLPIDGVLAGDIEGDIALTDVRISVAMDPRPAEDDEDVAVRARAGLILLDAPEGGANDVAFDLIVRGDHVAVSYTRVQDTEAMTTRRDLGLALPPGSVDARPVDVDGTRAHRVRIHTSFPVHYSHDCWQGFWVVRAWYEGGGEAFASTYAEYGYCE